MFQTITKQGQPRCFPQTRRLLQLCQLSSETPALGAPTGTGPAGTGQPLTASRLLHGWGSWTGPSRGCRRQRSDPAEQEAALCSQPLSEHGVPQSSSVPGTALGYHEQYKEPCLGVLALGSAVHRASERALNLPDHRE